MLPKSRTFIKKCEIIQSNQIGWGVGSYRWFTIKYLPSKGYVVHRYQYSYRDCKESFKSDCAASAHSYSAWRINQDKEEILYTASEVDLLLRIL